MQKKTILFILLLPIFLNAQIQIGTDIDGEAASDYSGTSVSLSSDGSVVAIGAYGNDGNGVDSGNVRIYKDVAGTWTQVGADINGEAAGDSSGISVSLSLDGSVVAIGAYNNAGNGVNSGHVRIYKDVTGTWTQVGTDINGEAASDSSGISVSLSPDGSVVAIGANGNADNGVNSGHVRIYKDVLGTWTQIGMSIDGETSDDNSGTSVSLNSDGSVVAIGAHRNDGNGSNSGHVRIYEDVAGTWTQVGTDIDGEAIDDRSGTSVSLSSDGSVVAIGANRNDGNGSNSGHVRVYKDVLGTWTQVGTDIDGEAAGDLSGHSVSLSSDGSIVAIGAVANAGNGLNSGHVRIYKDVAGTWTLVGVDIDGEAAGDNSGRSLSLSSDGSVVAIGAFLNADNGSNSGHVRIYDLSVALSISDEFVMQNFTVFPNPSNSTFTISLGNSLALKEVSLIDSYGRQILKSTKLKLNISSISQGVYYLKVTTNEGIGIKKVIVE